MARTYVKLWTHELTKDTPHPDLTGQIGMSIVIILKKIDLFWPEFIVIIYFHWIK